MTADTKDLHFRALRGIMQNNGYPGLAQLAARVVWDETARTVPQLHIGVLRSW